MFRLLYKVIDKDLMKNISKSLPIFMVAGKRTLSEDTARTCKNSTTFIRTR